MRSIGVAERAIEAMCARRGAGAGRASAAAGAQGRLADGHPGNKAAHSEIQAIKIATPVTVEWILDKAIQVHGAGGVSQDFPLAAAFAGIRTLRLADGPDEVHKNALARTELKRQRARREGTR
jgi:acyl-CoA dehydrogenase